MPFARILVPVDFSPASQNAIRAAIDLAKAFDSHLTLLHVWSIPSMGYAEALSWPLAGMEEAAQSALDARVASVAKEVRRTSGILRFGVDWERILDVAETERIGLVVMGTHGRTGLPRLLLGSVAEKVVRMSKVPVLTVRGADTPAH